jgi:putative two-component system response regulator
LLKPGKLSTEEFEIMQKHTSYGRQITQSLPEHELNTLRDHAQIGSRLLEQTESPVLAMAAIVSLSHHERWDGSGYPQGRSGEEIPIEGRITAVADVFDALSSARPYKVAFPVDECFQILEDGRGRHFDPQVLDAFFACKDAILQTKAEFADP